MENDGNGIKINKKNIQEKIKIEFYILIVFNFF